MIYDDLWKSHLILFLHWYLQDKIDQNIKHILMRTSLNGKVSVSATHKQSRLHMTTWHLQLLLFSNPSLNWHAKFISAPSRLILPAALPCSRWLLRRVAEECNTILAIITLQPFVLQADFMPDIARQKFSASLKSMQLLLLRHSNHESHTRNGRDTSIIWNGRPRLGTKHHEQEHVLQYLYI